jgi:hypothetical protein
MDERHEDGRDEAFERRARELFEASVADLDAATRARLAAARRAALESAPGARRAPWGPWVPVAAVAATAAVVAVLVLRPEGEVPATGPAVAEQPAPTAAPEALEVLVAGEDLDLVAEDLEFYDWIELAALDTAGGQG